MAYDVHSLFAYSTVVSASQTSTTATVTVQTGDGAKFSINQQVTLWPNSIGKPLFSNAMVGRITGITGNQLTIDITSTNREGSSQTTVVAGFQIANTMTPKIFKDIEASVTKGATLTVAASNSKNTYNADYVCTGVNDDVVINAAIQAAIAVGGGKVILYEGTFIITNPILINAYNVWLQGMGWNTIIQQANSANVTTHISINGFNIAQIRVSDLHIEGNKANNTFGNGITTQTPNSENSWVILDNVVVWNCPNNGIAFNPNPGSSSYYFTNIHVAGCLGNGFWAGYNNGVALTDSVFINCISETNALNGFYLSTLDTHFYGCKSYFNGSAGGSNHGFYIAGYNNYFDGCEAQDNYGCGFFLNNDGDPTYGTQNNAFTTCDADSNYNPANSRGATVANSPTGYGWYINNTVGTQLLNCQSYVRPYPFAWGQNIGIGLLGTTTGTYVSSFRGSGNTSSLYSDTSSGSNFPWQVQGVVNKVNGDVNFGTFHITGGVSNATVTALTPSATVSLDPTKGDVFTLVPAQIETINAASVVSGQTLKLIITTSGTSSFVLTFNTSFKTTGTLTTGTVSGKVFTITFVSDGTNYNEVSRTTAM